MKKAGWEPASSHGWEGDNMNAEVGKVKGEADVIFFDAAGTLIYLARPVGWHYALIARKHGLQVDEARMESAFREVWRARPARPPSTGPRVDDDRPWWRALALDVLRTASPSAAKIDGEAWFAELYAHFAQPGIWLLYEDARRCLHRLQGRHRLAVISNFDGRLRRVLDDLGASANFEKVFISSELGCEKPHRAIFRQALELMNVGPERCIHAGDDPERDWAGAAAAGLGVFRVRRPSVTLDDFESDLASEPRPVG
jgi:putative hydrolase of the HAD superfamily